MRPKEKPLHPTTSLEEALASLQEALGYHFRERRLLLLALGIVESPFPQRAAAARQRLEFLGDAVWNFVVALAAFQIKPQATAGDLTRLRSAWCSTRGLARLARHLGLPLPDESSLAKASQRGLAERLEAIMGAMVEDGGLEAIRGLAHRVVARDGVAPELPPLDPKSALQVATQARYGTLPTYRLQARRGPAHHPIFRVEVTVGGWGGELRMEAEGQSRQAAEQEAARLALEHLAQILNEDHPLDVVASSASEPNG